MALKFEVPTLDGMSTEIAGLYTKEGDVYRLQVEGAVPKVKLEEFRDSNIELRKKLEAFAGVDPTKYKEYESVAQKVKDKKLIEDGQVEEVVKQRIESMKTEYDGTIKDLSGKLDVSNRQLESLLIDSAVRAAAMTAKVVPTAVDDVLLRAKTTFKVVDGVATPLDGNGKVIYASDGVSPMPIGDWMKGLAKQAPHLFEGNQGGGAPHHLGRPGADTSKLTPTQKIQAALG